MSVSKLLANLGISATVSFPFGKKVDAVCYISAISSSKGTPGLKIEVEAQTSSGKPTSTTVYTYITEKSASFSGKIFKAVLELEDEFLNYEAQMKVHEILMKEEQTEDEERLAEAMSIYKGPVCITRVKKGTYTDADGKTRDNWNRAIYAIGPDAKAPSEPERLATKAANKAPANGAGAAVSTKGDAIPY